MDKEKDKKYKREYMKEYSQRPYVKEKRREYLRRPEVKARKAREMKKYRNKPGMNIIKNKVARNWRKNLDVMKKQNEYKKSRRKENTDYAIKDNIRSNFYLSLKKYSKDGKKMPLDKYWIDMNAIIKHLTPFPEPRENYHIDHISPLSHFNHNNPVQVMMAWLPSNLQWLSVEENLHKGDKFIEPEYNRGGRT